MESISAALAAFGTWLNTILGNLLEKLFNVLVDILQFLVDMVPVLVNAVLQFISYACPPPPLSVQQSAALSAGGALAGTILSMLLRTLNWLFPLQFTIYLFQMVICAIIAYMGTVLIGRWTKILT